MTNPTANPPARSVEREREASPQLARKLLGEMIKLLALAGESVVRDGAGRRCRVCGARLEDGARQREGWHREDCLACRILDSAVTLHELEESLKEESSPQPEIGPHPVIDPLIARDIVDVLVDELVARKVIPYSRWEDLTAGDLEELTAVIVKRYEKS